MTHGYQERTCSVVKHGSNKVQAGAVYSNVYVYLHLSTCIRNSKKVPSQVEC